MGRSFLNRFRAAVMAACFLCAGIILPDLDAVLFHGVPSQDESRPHVESTGSAACHAESCMLGAGLPAAQRSGGISSDFAKLREPSTLQLPAVASITDRSPTGSFDSRAPPA